jgi:late competence protein required for DNA uptake (superfamily II DNA/RNA helicase)
MDKEINRRILTWYENSSKKTLNIKTVPYRGVEPLVEVSKKSVSEGGRILYITGEDKDSVLLVHALEEAGIENVEICHGEETDKRPCLVICDYTEALRVIGNYDLVIYDDVNSFPFHRKPEMQSLISYIYSKCRKVIAYSFETVFFNVETVEVALAESKNFVSEPRIIETRVNLLDEIPISIYEYLLWFIYEKRNVLLVTTDSIISRRLVRYLSRIDESITPYVVDVSHIGRLGMQELVQREGGPHIFVTDDLEDYLNVPVNFEIIVHGADSERFSFRELLFYCLRSGYYDDVNGEVILLCQSQTPDIEKTKSMTRYFNKVIWDQGYLKG